MGLRYQPRDGRSDIILLRCNGQHGIFNHSRPGSADHSHWNYHVHRADEKAIANGFRAEKFAEKTTEYASYQEAVVYFVAAINIRRTDINKYFARDTHTDLFE